MSGWRRGARWYLRASLAAILLVDLVLLAAFVSLADPGNPRALARAPAFLHAYPCASTNTQAFGGQKEKEGA